MNRSLIALFLFAVAATVHAGERFAQYDDDGPTSLRQAILDANSGACASPCAIGFQSGGVLSPLSPLPVITADGVTIAGASNFLSPKTIIDGRSAGFRSGLKFAGAHNVKVSGLAVINFQGNGIIFDGVSEGAATDCWLGIDPRDNSSQPNLFNGMSVVASHNVQVGGEISGSNGGSGVYVAGSNHVDVGGCEIGKGWPSDDPRPNQAFGVFVTSSTAVRVDNNTIANNVLSGVGIEGASTQAEIDIFNRIFHNGLLGIQLINSANLALAAPRITRAIRSHGYTEVTLVVHATPNRRVLPALFISDPPNALGAGQGRQEVGFSYGPADANGDATFNFYLTNAKSDWLVASWAIDGFPGTIVTSPFSDPVKIVDADLTFHVTSTDDSGPGTLRQAIIDSSSAGCRATFPCLIDFLTSGTIQPLTPLPPVESSGMVINGYSAPVVIDGAKLPQGNGLELHTLDDTVAFATGFLFVRGLTVRGFNGNGIAIVPAKSSQRTLARIDGCTVAANRGDGILLQNASAEIGTVFDNRINTEFGGHASAGNVIIGNGGNGIHLISASARAGGDRIENNGLAGVLAERSAFYTDLETVAYNGAEGVHSILATTALGTSSVHDNWLKAISGGRSNKPAIIAAHYDPSSATTTVRASIDSAPPGSTDFDIINLYVSSHPDPNGIAEMPFTSSDSSTARVVKVTSGLSAGASAVNTFDVTMKKDLSGKFITATAVRFDWFAYIQIGSTSDVSDAMQVTTDLCGTPVAPLLTSPPPGAALAASRPVVFDWTSVDASSYDLWVGARTQQPGVRATLVTPGATLTLAPGEYEWWVEAKSNGCYSAMALPQAFIVQTQ